MKQNGSDKGILYLSIPLSIFTAVASFSGIFIEKTYSKETASYAAQGIGQDLVNLFIVVPVLLLSAFLAYRKNKVGLFLWSGSVFYIAYSYTIYAFAIHFNTLFIIYCAILGLSFYSFVYFIYKSMKEDVLDWFDESVPVKSISVFLFIIASLFYVLWLSEIIPAIITNSTPSSVTESGLLTNPVHVLDLSICLPALIITGILLIRKNKIAFLLVPAFLSFFIFMAIAIIAMLIVMKIRGLEADIQLTVIFGIITFVSMYFLIRYLKKLR